jgi:xanthine/CO dehydrogenase XdhC/CoxF family maturation factor
MLNILQQVVAAVEHNEPAALATVVEVMGASPAQVGAKILVRGDGIAIIPED